MSTSAARGLTISAVAERTGVSVPVLRAWERRFGFPEPERLDSGHRRYSETEVERILRVVSARAHGRSLEAAIDLARDASPGVALGQQSIFAGLRRARPDLTVSVLGRRTMLALSRAIEDECLAQAERPHLVAAFQHEALVRAAHRRWEVLASSAASTLVLADFERSRIGPAGSLEIALPPGAPARREWSVVCDAPGSAAVLVGWERPEGTFEALWTVEPQAVRLATLVARHLATFHAPELALPPAPDDLAVAVDPDVALRRATALTNRVVSYLDR
jgi:DNA-binding transcriptional MerR regulator